jgi:putative transposase
MKYIPDKHHRQSIRLKGYDYRNAGAYFVTICTKNRECVLDDPIINAIIHDVWMALPMWFPTVELDEFIIMPNHVHFVIWLNVGTPLAGVQITEQDGGIADGGKPRPYIVPKPEKINLLPALGDVVGAFKSLTFKVYLNWVKTNDPSRHAKFWQGNYYEHIIRNERELNAIRQYIIDNPKNWEMDKDNLENQLKSSPPASTDDYLGDLKELMGEKIA